MENEVCEVKINECSVFFASLEQLQVPQSTHDAKKCRGGGLEWTGEMLEKAARPLVEALSTLRQATESMAPDELELSMQLNLALKGSVPVFNILSTESGAQISAKFVWKKA